MLAPIEKKSRGQQVSACRCEVACLYAAQRAEVSIYKMHTET